MNKEAPDKTEGFPEGPGSTKQQWPNDRRLSVEELEQEERAYHEYLKRMRKKGLTDE